jgi:hypothetical protein
VAQHLANIEETDQFDPIQSDRALSRVAPSHTPHAVTEIKKAAD